MIQIFLADGTNGRTDEPTEGSTRGPRGPKKTKVGQKYKFVNEMVLIVSVALKPPLILLSGEGGGHLL